ncbi:tetratricopeptide repeat protein [Endozoicomonas ascidiicola]|uniref:tetratricopeptide repeat protein n=1 Tax=Endozoicomonas ascidiicola TaxID=1698521 RepID=UPI00082B5D1D|nr:SEL1-like repeat protein [Endozoicomonas ascidiicola]
MSKRIDGMIGCLMLVVALGANQAIATESEQNFQVRLGALVEVAQLGGLDSSLSTVETLQEVARKGDQATRAEAQLLIGRAYRDGLAGTGKNRDLAFTFFEQAAGRDGLNAEAQYELGRAYLNGEGTDRNLIAAYMWTELSLHKDNPLAGQAEIQKQTLMGMLNEQQREKAGELVTQLETLYLK